MTFLISNDKTKLTLIDEEEGEEIAIWELEQQDDVLFDSFPMEFNGSDIYNNTKITQSIDIYSLALIRISKQYFLPDDLLNSKIIYNVNGETVETVIDIYQTSPVYGKMFMIGNQTDKGTIGLLFLEHPCMIEGLFLSQPGLYLYYVGIGNINEFNFQIYLSEEGNINQLEWNTLDVKNNKTVNYNGDEYVKVADISSFDFDANVSMNIIFNGNVFMNDVYKYSDYNVCLY